MSSTAEPVQNRRSIAATAPLGSRTRTAPSARRVDVASSRAFGRDQSSQSPGSSLTWAGVRIDSSDCVLRKYRSAGSNKPLRAPRSSRSREGLNAVPTKKPYSPSTVRYGTFNVQVSAWSPERTLSISDRPGGVEEGHAEKLRSPHADRL